MSARSLLARLVAFPTVAGEPNLGLVSFVADRLEGLGAHVEILPGTRPDGYNLYAVLGPRDQPGGVLLAAHSDVVAVEGQAWTHDPFTLTEVGGRLYGRGTADMKGFLACVIEAIGAITVRAPVHIALSSDEELGCIGVPPLLDALAGLAAPPGCVVVGEPTGLRVATAHRGKVALGIELTGRAAHSSAPASGVNAVAYAGRLIVALLALPDVNIGPIAGGVRVNIVPDHCQLEIEVRTLPERDPAEVVERIRAAADALAREMRETAPEAGIELVERASYPGLVPGDDGFAARVAALAGDTGPARSLAFGTEAGLYQQRLGIPVVVCGPGSMEQAHRADEFIEIAQLEAGRAFVERLVRRP